METSQKIINGIILTMIASFAVVGALDKEPTHYCESREIKAYCYDLSSTMKTCYTLPMKQGGKRCDEWKEIPFIAEDVKPIRNKISSKREICDIYGCKSI